MKTTKRRMNAVCVYIYKERTYAAHNKYYHCVIRIITVSLEANEKQKKFAECEDFFPLESNKNKLLSLFLDCTRTSILLSC